MIPLPLPPPILLPLPPPILLPLPPPLSLPLPLPPQPLPLPLPPPPTQPPPVHRYHNKGTVITCLRSCSSASLISSTDILEALLSLNSAILTRELSSDSVSSRITCICEDNEACIDAIYLRYVCECININYNAFTQKKSGQLEAISIPASKLLFEYLINIYRIIMI